MSKLPSEDPFLTTSTSMTIGGSTSHFILQTDMGVQQLPLGALPELGVSFIRVTWVDLTNTVRYRVLPLSYFYRLLQSAQPGLTVTKSVMGLVLDTMAEGFSPIGEYIYAVDLTSLRVCTYAPGNASVLGFFQAKTNIGKEVDAPVCPRTILQRIVRQAEETLHTRFLVGTETEFVLLRSTVPPVPVNSQGWCASGALMTGAVETQVMEEIAKALIDARIELQVFHSEAVNGQYEVVTGPLPPLEAADVLVHTRETIYNIAHKHGLRATLAPRLRKDKYGSGAHVHISVQKALGSPPSPVWSEKPPLTRVEAQFLAGLLEHLPAVSALTLPLPQSYCRMIDGMHAGGTWVCWGVDNREAPIRLTNETQPKSRNFEVKTIDGTSNPYLVLAGLLAAGTIGIRDELGLVHDNCGDGKTAAEMTREERESKGIHKRLPSDIGTARKYLLEDKKLKELLGEEAVSVFVRVNEALGKAINREGEAEDTKEMRLIESY
ncbi:hypothetical protein EV401DRAFT_995316 [Pisolithus croceorrhizus]|nr:hypothetical protein EV401DRAFT_995316 [Pisolithus croceorrhizus]